MKHRGWFKLRHGLLETVRVAGCVGRGGRGEKQKGVCRIDQEPPEKERRVREKQHHKLTALLSGGGTQSVRQTQVAYTSAT